MKYFFYDNCDNDQYRFLIIGYNHAQHQELLNFFPYMHYIQRNNQQIHGLYISIPKYYITWIISFMFISGFIFEPDSYINQVNPDDPEYIDKVFRIVMNQPKIKPLKAFNH